MSNVGFKTIACGLSHSGCVLDDGTVYLWGIIGDIQQNKESMEKFVYKKPTKVSFKASLNVDNNGNTSHRRRSGVEDNSVIIDDIKLGD